MQLGLNIKDKKSQQVLGMHLKICLRDATWYTMQTVFWLGQTYIQFNFIQAIFYSAVIKPVLIVLYFCYCCYLKRSQDRWMNCSTFVFIWCNSLSSSLTTHIKGPAFLTALN